MKTYEHKHDYERLGHLIQDREPTYQIYDNDLKYKKYKYIDTDRILDYTDTEDRDTLNYRLKESQKDKEMTLDLCHLNLSTLPQNLSSNTFYLFLTDNLFENINDLTYCKHLRVLDVYNNKLTHLPKLPTSIEEVSCRQNNLISIDTLKYCPNIKRLDCSNNKLLNISTLHSLEILICDNNNLTELPILPNIIKLNCNSNKINELNNLKNTNTLRILECDNNKLTSLPEFTSIEELYCNNNKINQLSNLNRIRILHCYENPLKLIPFYNTLKELLCDYGNIGLSKLYANKIIDKKLYKDDSRVLFMFE